MSKQLAAETDRRIRYLLSLVWSLRRLWGIAESEREKRLLGSCLRQQVQRGERLPESSVGSTIDQLWDGLDIDSQQFAYATTVLLELDERELEFVFEDSVLWQTAYWGNKLITGPPQWPLAYELLRGRLTEGQNLDQQIESNPELLGLVREHGNVYWEHYCQVLRNLVSEELRHEFATPLNWRRVAERLQLSRQLPLARS